MYISQKYLMEKLKPFPVTTGGPVTRGVVGATAGAFIGSTVGLAIRKALNAWGTRKIKILKKKLSVEKDILERKKLEELIKKIELKLEAKTNKKSALKGAIIGAGIGGYLSLTPIGQDTIYAIEKNIVKIAKNFFDLSDIDIDNLE